MRAFYAHEHAGSEKRVCTPLSRATAIDLFAVLDFHVRVFCIPIMRTDRDAYARLVSVRALQFARKSRYPFPLCSVFLPLPVLSACRFCLKASKSVRIRNETRESGLAFSCATKYLLKETLERPEFVWYIGICRRRIFDGRAGLIVLECAEIDAEKVQPRRKREAESTRSLSISLAADLYLYALNVNLKLRPYGKWLELLRAINSDAAKFAGIHYYTTPSARLRNLMIYDTAAANCSRNFARPQLLFYGSAPVLYVFLLLHFILHHRRFLILERVRN